MTLAMITLSPQGLAVARALAQSLPDCTVYAHREVHGRTTEIAFDSVTALTGAIFAAVQGLLYVAPCGVAVRSIAPHLGHKSRDPAVVVVDVGHRHAISLLSGHQGGANRLATLVANLLQAEPAITTTGEAVRRIIAGVGCRRGMSADRIETAVGASLAAVGCGTADLRLLASVSLKAEERGLHEAARRLGVPLRFIHPDEIRAAPYAFPESPGVRRHLDLPAVAEPCALLAGRRTRFILRKTAHRGVTVALAREQCMWSESDPVAG